MHDAVQLSHKVILTLPWHKALHVLNLHRTNTLLKKGKLLVNISIVQKVEHLVLKAFLEF